jgi:hypothetical protein
LRSWAAYLARYSIEEYGEEQEKEKRPGPKETATKYRRDEHQ